MLSRCLWLAVRVLIGAAISAAVLAVAVFAGRFDSVAFRVFPARRPPGDYEARPAPKLEAPDARALDGFRAGERIEPDAPGLNAARRLLHALATAEDRWPSPN